jgi:hypothetical protein
MFEMAGGDLVFVFRSQARVRTWHNDAPERNRPKAIEGIVGNSTHGADVAPEVQWDLLEHRKVLDVVEPMTNESGQRYRPGRGTNLSLSAPCLYPGCVNTVTLRPRGGLPTQFCGDDCRSNYRNISRQLQRTKIALAAEAGDNVALAAEHAAALRLVEWHLDRFRSADAR